MSAPQFEALKAKPSEARKRLEAFPTPPYVSMVTMSSDEVTSLCPITNQPDFETIEIEYTPRELCLESKSLKLYFQALRDEGAFIETLSSEVCRDVVEALQPQRCVVTATQKPRGGVKIVSVAVLQRTPQGYK